MRSRSFVCAAALAGSCLFGTLSPVAHAADPKGKGKKSTSDSSDSAINKQMQWEESVMGPDDGKNAELAKIARAQAINKAAAEKAAKEKEKADAQAARDKEKADAAPKTNKRGGEVALPTLPDEDSGKGKNGKASEISPKLETTAAAAPPPPVKHGDDKFIDGLLKDDGRNKKHKTSASEDKALDDLLATDKPAAPAKGKGKKDDVDALLSAKPQPMPETHVKHETPEWAKPEISASRVEAPVLPVRQQPKKDDGIIHVTQGAAPTGRPVPAHVTAPPARTSTVATRVPASRHEAPSQSSSSGSWNDPFAASGAPKKKTVAAREAHHSDSGADDLDGISAVPHRRPARGDDGDSDSGAKSAGTRRAAPAAKPKWKDPFTESESTAPARPALATREPRKGEASKWDVAERHAPAAAEPEATRSRSGRWGVLKKHAH
ncbi:MAG TPA: hypothetical protein VKZ18_18420 [Polyangia bacterium]|nr:hypothetical protein [Polyangia bacterium]